MNRALKFVLAVLMAGFIVIQFVGRPDRTNPPEDPALTLEAQTAVPEAVRNIVNRSCADCHSHRTAWPWYSAVAPASWLVANDVEEGREQLNFSVWGSYSVKQRASRLQGISSEVDKGDMPMKLYVLMHGDAGLSEADKDVLCAWAEQLSDSLIAPTP